MRTLHAQDPYYGMVRLATAVTHTKVANPAYNLERHLKMVRRFAAEQADIGQFGELSLTGYSCGRYFQQRVLINAAEEALITFAEETKDIFNGLLVVGAPLVIDNALFNCGITICRGKFLGISVKRFPPNYEEFTELKEFPYGRTLRSKFHRLGGQKVPVGTNLIYRCTDVKNLMVANPICEDDWVQGASSYFFVSGGATVLCSINGSDELVGKEDYRRDHQVVGMSARCIAAYATTSQGPGESTTNVAFSGYHAIADNGTLLEEVKPLVWVDTIGDPEILGESMLTADVDLDHIAYDRMRTNSFVESAAELDRMRPHRYIDFELQRDGKPRDLRRKISAHPYVPQDDATLAKVCEKLVRIKLAGDVQRLMSVGNPDLWVAFSGGLDSTARLLDAVKAKRTLRCPPSSVHALTMPGFGTGKRSYGNVWGLGKALGVTMHEVDIRPLCFAIMKALGHKPFGIDLNTIKLRHEGDTELEGFCALLKEVPKGSKDLMFENVQAHVRTLIVTRCGFAFGTGDMSELIIGWCTFLADQLGGHYNSQATQPKTLVRFQVGHQAMHEFDGDVRKHLLDILDQVVSPELLPTDKSGQVTQVTDQTNGPEEVRDFFMRYFRRYGDTPEKILWLFEHANRQGGFKRVYTQAEVFPWWERFAERTFGQRFKNACRIDGVQLGSDSLSPHGNWMVPSDASGQLWKLPEGFDLAPYFVTIDKQLATPVVK